MHASSFACEAGAGPLHETSRTTHNHTINIDIILFGSRSCATTSACTATGACHELFLYCVVHVSFGTAVESCHHII